MPTAEFAPAVRVFSPRVDQALLDRLSARVTTVAPRDRVDVRMPFTGEVLGWVPNGSPDDIREAARRSEKVRRGWAALPIRDRAAVFLRFHDLLLRRREEILDILQLEGGKARRHALEEVLDTAVVARYYAHVAPTLLRPRRRQGAFPIVTRTWEHHPPRGLAGFIVPWNYPLTLGISDTTPALIAGNGAIIKPDRQTPFSALWVVALLEEAGLPPGLAQVVTGEGSRLGPALIESVQFVMFTGSTATGRIVARQAAERLTDCSMELGGKNAMIVLEDADVEKAARGAVDACFSNGGQLCISIERMYVHDRVYEPFVRRFTEHTKNMRLSPAFDLNADMGSLVSREQLDAVSGHVEDAVRKGARVLTGGRARPDLGPYFYEPTVLENVNPEMELFEGETFGPVVSLYKFSTEEEAIQHANASPFGLNCSIWTRDTRRGHHMAQRIEAGTVNINDGYAAAWASVDAPMGGFKHSGLGRRHGEHGLLKYTEAQTIAIQHVMPISGLTFAKQASYAAALIVAVKILKRLPGIR